MKCESLSLGKYLEKSQNIFFIFGSEVILRNNSKDLIKEYLSQKGFSERRLITKDAPIIAEIGNIKVPKIKSGR